MFKKKTPQYLFKKTLVLALAGLSSTTAWAAATDSDALLQEMRRLAQRVEQLEAANKKLESALGRSGNADVKEMAARIEDVENEVLALRKPSALEEALDGVSASASLTMVAQHASGGSVDGGQLTGRADVEVELPGGSIGDAEGKIFAHLRAGDGDGVDTGAFATSNATAFNFAQPVLMQAWYQLDIPVGGKTGSLGQVEVTAGKIDPFGFFDGNNIADDESEQFLNLAFIHNPLLDAGGDIGVGEHGASPGLRLAYVSDINSGNRITASLGLFGAGEGANYSDTFGKHLTIAQLEYAGKTFGGLEGAWRLYGWNNGRAEDLADPANQERHTGWGVSIDQQVADHVTLFTRLGLSTKGEVAFDRAFTLGAQFDGGLWGRENDRIGLAAGWLKVSDEYKLANPGFSGAEKPLELYYAWQLNDNLQLSPSVQWIGNPGGDPTADDVTVFSLRAKAAF
ncbi:MAG: carbohydrate porin [Hydrogenophilaceae bacterium]|nr:carbohydrate porin [Hydrogenophilaceae bacterium]